MRLKERLKELENEWGRIGFGPRGWAFERWYDGVQEFAIETLIWAYRHSPELYAEIKQANMDYWAAIEAGDKAEAWNALQRTVPNYQRLYEDIRQYDRRGRRGSNDQRAVRRVDQ